MKNYLIKSILALLLILVSMPMMGQDYLTIKLKDGKEVRHLLALVNEMSTSKYDADGVMYSDYAFQLVSMRDTVYYYAIEDIESISFKSVDQEQIKENTESALSSVVSVLEDLESFDDIKNRSDEIAHAEGVEKVDVHDKAIVVRIKDWRDIVILDTPDKGDNPSGLSAKQRMPRYVMPIISKSPKINNSVRVAIADQNAKNEAQGYVNSTNVLLEIKNHFSQLGYDVKYIPQPSLDFFREDIFKNDVIMLTTHGFYLDGKHWFATGEEIGEATQSWLNSKLDSEDFWGKDNFELYYNYIDYDLDLDYVRLSYIPETRGGKKKWILYTICSEDYIGNSPFKFEKGDAVIFANVCESLTDNHSVAEMFHRKGTAAYLGYEGTTYYGEYAGGIFFSYQMLNGASAAYAYGKIPDNEKVESDQEGAILRYLPNPKNSSNPKFITKTITAPSSEVKDEITEGNTHAVTLYGYATMRENTGEVKMAFQISQNENMENAQTVLCNTNYSETDNQNGNIKFWGSVEAEPGNTYYYRAYTYDDGMNPNYGEICSFAIEATKKLIKVEPTEIDFGQVEVGSSKSETFTVSNVGTASLTVTVASGLDEGDDCVLAGSGQQFTLAVGQSKTFTLTYTPTQENAGFNAIVRILSDAENDTEIVTVSGRSYKASVDPVAYTSCPDSHHPHLIDLGLPSGTKWACCNVGAEKPDDYGSSFAWGETRVKDSYSVENYLDGKGTDYNLGKDIAGTQYDAATVNWGSPWVMPNLEKMNELVDNCTSEWTTENGVNGRRFTGPNGTSIFFPATGYDGGLWGVGSLGYYWVSTHHESNLVNILYFDDGIVTIGPNLRDYGRSVRPVMSDAPVYPDLQVSQTQVNIDKGSSTTVEITSGSGEYGVTNLNSSIAKATLQGTTITISALAEGDAKVVATDMQTGQKIIIEITVTIGGDIVAYTSCPDSHHPHLIDLGLPSGTKWACCNVGASKPEDYGGYFAWGETTEKSYYDWNTYTHCDYDGSRETCHDIGKDIAGTQYDAATANWGSPWVMPSREQMDELLNNCTSEWTTENGVNGRRFTSPNGASIFLPAAGTRCKDDLDYAGSFGGYWSSTLIESITHHAETLDFRSGYVYTYGDLRYTGQSVRPVRKN